VVVSKVEITAIREVTSRRSASRRLLATSVEVDFRVAAADTAAAQSLASKLDATSLNTALAKQGLPAATVLKSAAVKSSVVLPTTTPAPSVTPLPPPTDFTTYVEMVVSLPLSRAEFTSAKQANFLAGVASAAGVVVSKVEITAIREVTSRRSASRRLLATSVEVDFRVAAADTAAAQSLASKLDATSLNAALKWQGLPEATVVKGATVVSDGQEIRFTDVAAIVGGVVGGLLGFVALVAAILYYNRTRQNAAGKLAEVSSLENATSVVPTQPAARAATPPPLPPPLPLPGLQVDEVAAGVAGVRVPLVPLHPGGHPKTSDYLGDITPESGRSFSAMPAAAMQWSPPDTGSGAAMVDSTWATHGGVFAVASSASSGSPRGGIENPTNSPTVGANTPVMQNPGRGADEPRAGLRSFGHDAASLGLLRGSDSAASASHMEPVPLLVPHMFHHPVAASSPGVEAPWNGARIRLDSVEHESHWSPYNPTTHDARRTSGTSGDMVTSADMVFGSPRVAASSTPPRVASAASRAPPSVNVLSIQSIQGATMTHQGPTTLDIFGLQDIGLQDSHVGDA